MVNCKNCGAPLTLDSPVCPNCGTPNPEAQEHLKKLAQLDKQYQNTRYEVVNEVKKTKKGYNVLTFLVVILLANMALIPIHGASYEIADRIIASRKGTEQIKAEMDGWLGEKNYDAFVVTYDKYSVDYRDYEEYNPIYYMASTLVNIKQNLSDYLYGKNLYSDPLVRGCQYIKEFKEDYTRYNRRESSEFTMKHLEQMYQEYEAILKTFLKLTDEDIESLGSLTNSEVLLLVNRRLNNEE